MQPISSASTRRFRALIADVAAVSGTPRPARVIALADRLQRTAVYRLDLDTGCLSTEGSTYDIIILDSAAARRLSTDGIGVLQTFFGPEGVIAIRRPQSWTGAVRRVLRRRGDDVSPNPFLRGLPRSGAAFLRARLYVVELERPDQHIAERVLGDRKSGSAWRHPLSRSDRQGRHRLPQGRWPDPRWHAFAGHLGDFRFPRRTDPRHSPLPARLSKVCFPA